MHSLSAGKLSTQASGSLAFMPSRIEITFSLINRTLFLLANALRIHEHQRTVSGKGLNSIAEVVCESFCRHHGALRRGQPQSHLSYLHLNHLMHEQLLCLLDFARTSTKRFPRFDFGRFGAVVLALSLL